MTGTSPPHTHTRTAQASGFTNLSPHWLDTKWCSAGHQSSPHFHLPLTSYSCAPPPHQPCLPAPSKKFSLFLFSYFTGPTGSRNKNKFTNHSLSIKPNLTVLQNAHFVFVMLWALHICNFILWCTKIFCIIIAVFLSRNVNSANYNTCSAKSFCFMCITARKVYM